MSSVADDLREALTGAYASYVVDRVQEQELDIPSTLENALEEGERWLGSTLADLLARPYAHQHRGPLEVFQEAMRFPTEALSTAGLESVRVSARAVTRPEPLDQEVDDGLYGLHWAPLDG